jgi:dienelactone hydrolase
MLDRLKVQETLIMRVPSAADVFRHVCELEDDAMSRFVIIGLLMLAVAVGQTVAVSVDNTSKDLAARVEAIPVQTLTITDGQFLKGDAYGRPTTIAVVLRIAQGSGRLPAVILVHGSGGFNANVDLWDQQFGPLGISTFAMDSFTGRGIVSTVVDQSQLGRLNMILDLYRSLSVLASHPRVDPNRIAVIGFSRGVQATLYASLKRFHKIWNPGGIDPAAYIAFYSPCITTYIDDTDVSDHPIRMFHGISDDYVEIGPCRSYFQRLKQRAKDVEMPSTKIHGTRLIIRCCQLRRLLCRMPKPHTAT